MVVGSERGVPVLVEGCVSDDLDGDTPVGMHIWSCKCGMTSTFGTKIPDKCDACLYCGSTLALPGDEHGEPLPHDYSVTRQVTTDQGVATITQCLHCGRTPAQVEERDRRDRTTTKPG